MLVSFMALGLLLVVCFKDFRYGKAELEPPLEDRSAFSTTRAIKFAQRNATAGGFADQGMTISDSNTVHLLVSAIRLQQKEPCLCGHTLQATFQTASGDIFVSFCDHCFDIQKTSDSYEGVRLYRMPRDFYATFYRLAKTQTNGWFLAQP